MNVIKNSASLEVLKTFFKKKFLFVTFIKICGMVMPVTRLEFHSCDVTSMDSSVYYSTYHIAFC